MKKVVFAEIPPDEDTEEEATGEAADTDEEEDEEEEEEEEEDEEEPGPKILSGGGWGEGTPKEQPRAGLGSGTSPPARMDQWVLTAHVTLHSTLADDASAEEVRGMLISDKFISGPSASTGAARRSGTSRSTGSSASARSRRLTPSQGPPPAESLTDAVRKGLSNLGEGVSDE